MLAIEDAIINRLGSGPCGFNELVFDLADFTWEETFNAVDGMSGNGRVSILRLGPSVYRLSLGPQFASPNTPVREAGAAPPLRQSSELQ